MRILVVSSVFPNPVARNLGTFVLERARAYRSFGEVQVVAPVPFAPKWLARCGPQRWSEWARVPDRSRVDGIDVLHPRRVVIPKVGSFTSGLFYARSMRRVLRELYAERPFDLIDCHFVWPDGFGVVEAARELGVPVCVTAQGTDVNYMPRFPAIRPFIRRTLRRATRVLAVSHALAELCFDAGCPEGKLRIVPPGVDLQRFTPLDRLEARRRLGLDERGQILVSVGALIERKGHQRLIAALSWMRDQVGGPLPRLYLVGQGPERASLERCVRKHGLEDLVHLVGEQPHDEIGTWMSAADLTCLASSREGWPTVLFESWAAGTPVLATAVHGVPEAITSPELGTSVPSMAPEDLAWEILAALEREWDRGILRRHAEQHTWSRVAYTTLGIFQAVLPGTDRAQRRA